MVHDDWPGVNIVVAAPLSLLLRGKFEVRFQTYGLPAVDEIDVRVPNDQVLFLLVECNLFHENFIKSVNCFLVHAFSQHDNRILLNNYYFCVMLKANK